MKKELYKMLRLTSVIIKSKHPLFIGFITKSPTHLKKDIFSNVRHWTSLDGPRAVARPNFPRTEENDKRISPLGWLLLLIPVTTFGLGCWQVKRKAWKEQLIKEMDQLKQLPAVPLPDNLSDMSQLEYRLVNVRGKFLHDKELLMGPRSFIRPDGAETVGGLFSQRDAGNGYLIITPFKLADRDDIILVNRGWVSRKHGNPKTRSEGQIEKEIELTGVVRSGEKIF